MSEAKAAASTVTDRKRRRASSAAAEESTPASEERKKKELSPKRKTRKLTARDRAAAASSSSSAVAASSSSACQCSANRVTCVIAPGAGGSLSGAMADMLFKPLGSGSSSATSFDVRVISCKWNIRDAGSAANISQVLSHCQCASASAASSSSASSSLCKSPLVVFGHSFGCRVLCEMVTRRSFVRQPKAIILMSFPMYPPPPATGDAKKNERVRQLLAAFTNGSPPPLLLISGDKDEFLLREYLPHATDARKTMQAAIQPIAQKRSNAVTVEWIDGGLHGLPQCQPRSRTQQAASRMIQIIRSFIAST